MRFDLKGMNFNGMQKKLRGEKLSYEKYELLLFFLIIFCHVFFFITTYKPCMWPDSWTYFDFSWPKIKSVIPMFWAWGRTPGYPVVIKVLRLLFGSENFLLATVWVQEIVCLVSLFLFHALLKDITNNKLIIFLTMFFYGCSPVVIGWNYCILTESFSISLCIGYLFVLSKFMKTKSDLYGMFSFAYILVIIFERPSFLLFLPVTICFVLFFTFIGKYKKMIKTYMSALFAVLVVLLYCFGFYKHFGIFSISDPVPRNLLIVSMERGYYRNSPNSEFKDMVDNTYSGDANNDLWPAMWKILDYYGLAESKRLAIESIKCSAKAYIKDEIKLSMDTAARSWSGYYYKDKKLDDSILKLKKMYEAFFRGFAPIHALFVSFFSLALVIVQLFKRKINWLLFGCACYVAMIFVSTMVVQWGEHRIMIHIMPIFYFNMVCLFDSVCALKDNKERFYIQNF